MDKKAWRKDRRVMVYLEPDIKAALIARARKNRRSLSREIMMCLYDYLRGARQR